MKLMPLSFLLFAFVYSSCAQKGETIRLWPDKVPGSVEDKHEPVQTDDKRGDVIRLTDVTDPAIVVFQPELSKRNGAAVIVCPGGGYEILAIDKEGYEVAEWLNTLGYTAFVLEYRVPQKQQEALYDIQRAIRMVRSKADTWALSSDQIGVMGFSAGGSLSARASTQYADDTYTKIDALDSASARPDFAILIYPAYLDKGENKRLTPELKVDAQTPPMFIFGTGDDQYGNSALVMTSALRDNHVPVELHFMPEGGHGYGLRKGNVAAETWPVLLETWLNEVTNQ